MRILYVENHEIFARVVIPKFLSAHEVVVAPSVERARVLLRESPPFDVAVVDYDLDDGKGDEVVREMRVLYPGVPVIASSSHDLGNEALMAAGARVVCAKMDFSGIQGVMEAVTRGAGGGG